MIHRVKYFVSEINETKTVLIPPHRRKDKKFHI